MPVLYHASPPQLTIPLAPLTSPSFARFGRVIESPFSASASLPQEAPSNATFANQGTALKLSQQADLTDYYAAHGTASGVAATPALTVFVCAARQLRDGRYLDIRVLERHKRTTQVFIPMGLTPDVDPLQRQYLVVVAPNLAHSAGLVGEGHMPDLCRMRAFIARGDQAVAYGPGTWHAPMVALGQGHVPFAVMQWMNDVPAEDCEECSLAEGLSVDLAQADSRKAKL